MKWICELISMEEQRIIQMMSGLSSELKTDAFVQDENGCFIVSFDDTRVLIYEKANCFVFESAFDFDCAKGLSFQQEKNLILILQAGLINMRTDHSVLSINQHHQLVLCQKITNQCNLQDFIEYLEKQVYFTEKYEQVFSRHTVSNSQQNTVWLP